MKMSFKINGINYKGAALESAEMSVDVEVSELMEYAEKMQGIFNNLQASMKEDSKLEHERALEIQKGEKEILKQQLEIAKLMK